MLLGDVVEATGEVTLSFGSEDVEFGENIEESFEDTEHADGNFHFCSGSS